MGKKIIEKWNNWNAVNSPKYPHEKVIQFFFRNFPKEVRTSKRVLDLGCGSGVHTIFLAEEGFIVSATDISEKGVENTKNKLLAKKLIVENLKQESISAISFPEDYFDVVFSVGVFDAAGIEETKKAVPLISKILKSGGIGFFIFASESDFRLQNNEYNLYGYSENEVKAIFCDPNYFREVWVDRYITTYQNNLIQQNDFIITTFK